MNLFLSNEERGTVSGFILDEDQMESWTGYKQAARQIRWLVANGHKFSIGGDGLPKVARSYYEAQYGAPEKRKPRVRTEGLART